MEILLELFITAFVAIIFSFLVAKLLSIDTAPAINSSLNFCKTREEESIVEKIKFDRGKLEFQSVVVGDHVNQLEGDGSFQKSAVSSCCEEYGQKSGQEEERSDDEYGGEREGEVMNPSMEESINDDDMIKYEQSEEMVVGEYQSAEAGDDFSEVEHESKQEDKENDGVVTDDEWEGIEQSELEKVFARATNYVAVKGLSSMESDVQMQLYDLDKIAMCQQPQPTPSKISISAKWNVWRRMGNMSPEAAMEQYIALLSAKDPTWSDGT